VSSSIQIDNRDYRFITEENEARDAVTLLQTESIIGLDTETYWDTRANRSHVSLVQIAARTGALLVFDALAIDIEILRPVIDSPDITMAAHNARFDEGMLLSAGLRPVSFVDTLRLARTALRLPSYSLASVSAHLFGIELDKSYQKSNWRRRPLTRGQLIYAATDAHIALEVYTELRRILDEQGRLAEALRSATLRPYEEKERQPRRRRPPQPPPRPLTDDERQTLAYLKKWRFKKSLDERVPAYMICPDKTLEHLAMERPTTLDALNNIHGLGPSRIERFGAELLQALEEERGERC
jgi:ribonuclease D